RKTHIRRQHDDNSGIGLRCCMASNAVPVRYAIRRPVASKARFDQFASFSWRSTALVENVSDFLGQSGSRKGLLDKLNTRVKTTLVDDGVAGVAGHEQNFELGTLSKQHVRQLATVLVRQDDIGEQQIDMLSVINDLQRRLAAVRLEHHITQVTKCV